MWNRSSKQRKSAVRRKASVGPREAAHRVVVTKLFGKKLDAVIEAGRRAKLAASTAKLKAKKQGRTPKAKQPRSIN
jgi:ribosomal protein L12E/L44/L45/RPP1/RPP2